MSSHLLHSLIISVLLVMVAENLSGCTLSDEQVLRKAFNLPKSVKLVAIDSRPKASGKLGREGLKIDATFKFFSTDFDTYQDKVKQNIHWKALPLSRSFLIKITGIRRVVKSKQRAYEILGKSVPEGSIYNPTEDQLLEEWTKKLPLNVKNGFYRCLTAGDNLMYTRKVSCSEKPGDLNDFMLAVLDLDNKTLRVKVHTAY